MPGFLGTRLLRSCRHSLLSGGRLLVRIKWHQRSWLIRWNFLTDLACGFRSVRCASGPSSHARLQHLRSTTGITHHPWPLQIVCTSSHTVVRSTPQTSVERFSLWEAGAGTLFEFPFPSRKPPPDLVPVDRSVSIMGLVELPAGHFGGFPVALRRRHAAGLLFLHAIATLANSGNTKRLGIRSFPAAERFNPHFTELTRTKEN